MSRLLRAARKGGFQTGPVPRVISLRVCTKAKYHSSASGVCQWRNSFATMAEPVVRTGLPLRGRISSVDRTDSPGGSRQTAPTRTGTAVFAPGAKDRDGLRESFVSRCHPRAHEVDSLEPFAQHSPQGTAGGFTISSERPLRAGASQLPNRHDGKPFYGGVAVHSVDLCDSPLVHK